MSCRHLSAALVALACLAGCASAPVSTETAQVRVELLRGFSASRPALPTGRVALLVDATGSMVRATEAGPSRLRAARTAAQRFAERLPTSTPLELVVIGNKRNAGCEASPLRFDGERGELIDRAGRLRASGQGSLVAALDGVASSSAGSFERVVAITALDDGCGGDLCRSIERLARRGVRLDLVLIGGTDAPACASQVRYDVAAPPLADQGRAPVSFSVESVGHDAAVLGCSEAGGLPVRVPPGSAGVLVKLDPPLRVERNFLPGTRWVLQVLDFPSLDPPERRWRWRDDPGSVGTSPPARDPGSVGTSPPARDAGSVGTSPPARDAGANPCSAEGT